MDALRLEEIACGGASGADRLAEEWAKSRNITVSVFPANWGLFGKSAGPKRNIKMLSLFQPDGVVAFPGGRGTAHMIEIAKAAGVGIVEVLDRSEKIMLDGREPKK